MRTPKSSGWVFLQFDATIGVLIAPQYAPESCMIEAPCKNDVPIDASCNLYTIDRGAPQDLNIQKVWFGAESDGLAKQRDRTGPHGT